MATLLPMLGLGGGAAAGGAAASPFITQAAPYYAAGADAAAASAAPVAIPAATTPGTMNSLFGSAAKFANSSPGFLQGTGINYGQLAAAASSGGNTRDFAPLWNSYMQQQDAAFKTGMTDLGRIQDQNQRNRQAANTLGNDLGFSPNIVAPPQVNQAPGLTQFQ